LILWLGTNDFVTLTGWRLTSYIPGLVPEVVKKGMREKGMVWERALEDLVWIAVEGWKSGDWKRVREGVEVFPWKGEL
jgi:hypothetical protein